VLRTGAGLKAPRLHRSNCFIVALDLCLVRLRCTTPPNFADESQQLKPDVVGLATPYTPEGCRVVGFAHFLWITASGNPAIARLCQELCPPSGCDVTSTNATGRRLAIRAHQHFVPRHLKFQAEGAQKGAQPD
jgi:hypothetical protein